MNVFDDLALICDCDCDCDALLFFILMNQNGKEGRNLYFIYKFDVQILYLLSLKLLL